ncbi:MAG: class I SAM-dependent RNA methyltransferase [Deltaproteobacteria bacterium]|nr:class I SAM-dependent RNA methyltransferase [Deltaproteobacteria bacterium]
MELPKITVTIEKLNSEGEGLARYLGKVIFIPWGVPGDVVSVQIEEEQKDYDRGRILEIIQTSPDRADPPCPWFFNCGGCQLQQMSYEAQLKWKKEIVLDALRRIAKMPDATIEEVIPSPKILNYRNRIQIQRDREGKIGFFKAQSHEIVEIEKCLIADEMLNQKLHALRESLANPKPEIQISQSPAKPQALNPDQWPLELRVDDASGFSQVNPDQNEKLVQLVLEMADPKKTDQIFDLYCGSGNFTFPLATRAGHVWGIDKNQEVIEEGKKKAKESGMSNISWKHGTTSRVLAQLKKSGFACHTLVCDPPRRGIAESLEWIMTFKPQKIIYVSCNPATFARDTLRLRSEKYRLDVCQPLDMFPQTAHVELAALFLCEADVDFVKAA